MTATVSQILDENYGIRIRPGAKGDCPFCHHKTFSIKGDDLLGKCFHPSCQKLLTPANHGNGHKIALHKILNDIFEDCQRELLSFRERLGSNAYSYLTRERKIHPQVVSASMLGAVPRNYDIDAKFRLYLLEAEAAVNEEAKKKAGKRVRPKRDSYTAEDNLAFLKACAEKLSDIVRGAEGWLCFFYTDASHNIVAIRFRKPYTKLIKYFKPFERTSGLFGHGFFTEALSEQSSGHDTPLIVTEGEFNQLQLQSLMFRYAEGTGNMSANHACAIGGVNNADYETIRRVTSNPYICYDNDKGGAGLEVVRKAQESMKVHAFTTPQIDSDLDDYIKSFGDRHEDAFNSLKELIRGSVLYQRGYDGVRGQVIVTRQKQGEGDSRRDFEINMHVVKIIIEDLKDRGSFYNDGNRAYFFMEEEAKLFELDLDSSYCMLLMSKYGLNKTERVCSYVVHELRTEALISGTKIDVHRLSYYEPKTHTVYLNNNNNRIYRISPNAVDIVDNGTDGILFLSDEDAQPFDIGSTDGSSSTSLFDYAVNSQINFSKDTLSPNERKVIFTMWFLSLFFESIFPTKPILAFIGEKGSGKSLTARKVGMLLFGPKFNVIPLSDDPKDFDAAVTNSGYVAIDNADSKISWLDDRLATVATGGNLCQRKLYTNNTVVKIPVKCFLALTSRTPNFRRDDVADRLLIMKVERIKGFVPEQEILTDILSLRNQIMKELVYYIQEVTVALKAGRGRSDSTEFRMADFADFSIKVARYAGIEREMRNIFAKLSQEQSTFTLEDDPVLELLYLWATANPGIEVTNADLCMRLEKLADENGVAFPYKGNSRSFAQRMKNHRSNLADFFEITERPAGGHKKLFSFKPKK